MSSSSRALNAYQLTGLIERVTFFSEETGFCALQVKAEGDRDLVTVVGADRLSRRVADGRRQLGC